MRTSSEPSLVRRAEPADTQGILRVRTRSWQAAYAHVFPAESLQGLTSDDVQRADSWRRVIDEPPARRHMLVVDRDEEVAGFAFLGPARVGDIDAEDVGELYAIYVAPEAWGSGIGRALMARVLVQLREEGFREAILWVLEDNPRTRRFYGLAGWDADGGVKDEEWLGTGVRELRYRIALAP